MILQKLQFKERGQALAEYALIMVFVSLVMLGSYGIFRHTLAKYYNRTAALLSSFIP